MQSDKHCRHTFGIERRHEWSLGEHDVSYSCSLHSHFPSVSSLESFHYKECIAMIDVLLSLRFLQLCWWCGRSRRCLRSRALYSLRFNQTLWGATSKLDPQYELIANSSSGLDTTNAPTQISKLGGRAQQNSNNVTKAWDLTWQKRWYQEQLM